MIQLKPNDHFGREIGIGDWVGMGHLPVNISALPRGTQGLFRKALGRVFKIVAFGKNGHAELHLGKRAIMRKTIWVEPQCLELSRSGPKKSGTFGFCLHASTI